MGTDGQIENAAADTAAKEFNERRFEFLQKMYVQMFDDIKVQLQVVWQSVAVLAGTFAILALVEKGVVSLDIAVAIIVIIAAWLFAHTIEASYWYNRNLVIIANIERQFLHQGDLKDIHYYFGKHRRKGSMITHLKIQCAFAIAVAGLVLFFHFTQRVYPGMMSCSSKFDPSRCIPYLVLLPIGFFLGYLYVRSVRAYEEFLRNSPGAPVSTDGIQYGVGHPTDS